MKQGQDNSGNRPGGNYAYLSGEKVYLRPFLERDLENLLQWFNHRQTAHAIGESFPFSPTKAQEWFNSMSKDENRCWFAIVRRHDDKMIGECGLLRMYYPWRSTDLTMIIGDPNAQGKGYGTEAMELLLDYAFGTLNFHRVSLEAVSFNERAIKFYEKFGFRREGVRRESYYCDHKYHDFVLMGLLEEEYRARKKAAQGKGKTSSAAALI